MSTCQPKSKSDVVVALVVTRSVVEESKFAAPEAPAQAATSSLFRLSASRYTKYVEVNIHKAIYGKDNDKHYESPFRNIGHSP
jgi:hypothetical protein